MTTCCHTGVCVHTTSTSLQVEADTCHNVNYDLYAAVASDMADMPAVVNRAKTILTIAMEVALQDVRCAHRQTDAWTQR